MAELAEGHTVTNIVVLGELRGQPLKREFGPCLNSVVFPFSRADPSFFPDCGLVLQKVTA
jgi:hypothetical protein